MNLIALVKIVDLVLAYLEATWRRCARIMGTRTLNVAYILVLVVLSSWLLLASLTRIPRIRVQQCRHMQSWNDSRLILHFVFVFVFAKRVICASDSYLRCDLCVLCKFESTIYLGSLQIWVHHQFPFFANFGLPSIWVLGQLGLLQ